MTNIHRSFLFLILIFVWNISTNTRSGRNKKYLLIPTGPLIIHRKHRIISVFQPPDLNDNKWTAVALPHTIFDLSGKLVKTLNTTNLSINPKLWSPDEPQLYKVETKLTFQPANK